MEGGVIVMVYFVLTVMVNSSQLSPFPLPSLLPPSQKILEEQELRQDLQVKLLQSEQQLRQLKQTLGQPLNVNGPGTPEIDGSEFSPSKELPESVLPESVLPESVLPEGVLPEGVLPEGVLPEGVLPEGVLPEGVLPARELLLWISGD